METHKNPDSIGHVRPIPEFSNRATRERLTPAALKGMHRIVDHWRLSASDAAALAGLSERTWFRLKKGERVATLSQDEITRASVLVGIYKGLHLLLSGPLADEWVKTPNSNPLYDGQTPLEAMKRGGIPVMLRTRQLIDATRGGL